MININTSNINRKQLAILTLQHSAKAFTSLSTAILCLTALSICLISDLYQLAAKLYSQSKARSGDSTQNAIADSGIIALLQPAKIKTPEQIKEVAPTPKPSKPEEPLLIPALLQPAKIEIEAPEQIKEVAPTPKPEEQNLTTRELKAMARARKIPKWSRLTKAELMFSLGIA